MSPPHIGDGGPQSSPYSWYASGPEVREYVDFIYLSLTNNSEHHFQLSKSDSLLPFEWIKTLLMWESIASELIKAFMCYLWNISSQNNFKLFSRKFKNIVIFQQNNAVVRSDKSTMEIPIVWGDVEKAIQHQGIASRNNCWGVGYKYSMGSKS